MADDRPDAPERAGSRLDLRSTRRGFLAVTTATMAVTAGCGDDGPGGDGDANVAEPERRDENDSGDESTVTNESTEETEELTDDAGDESATESDDAAGESDERASDDGDDESSTEGDESTDDRGDSDDAESDPEGDDDGSGDGTDGDGGSSDEDTGDGDTDEDDTETDDASEDEGEVDETDRESEGDGNADADEESDDERDDGEDGESEDDAGGEDGEDDGDGEDDEDDENDADDEPPFDHPSARNMGHSPILGPGPADAPATIIMYDDPSCPACAYFEAEIFPDLESYVDAGELSVVWRGIPVIEDWGEGALQALWATYERDVDAFWALRDHLFAVQDSIASGEEAIDEAVSYLEAETTVDADGVRADAGRGRFTDRLANDEDAAARAGLDATPYFYLFRDGEFRTEIRGAQDARVFTSALEL